MNFLQSKSKNTAAVWKNQKKVILYMTRKQNKRRNNKKKKCHQKQLQLPD